MEIKGRLDEALDRQSKYCYPGTDVLINKLNLQSQEELDIAERRITTFALATIQLRKNPKPQTPPVRNTQRCSATFSV